MALETLRGDKTVAGVPLDMPQRCFGEPRIRETEVTEYVLDELTYSRHAFDFIVSTLISLETPKSSIEECLPGWASMLGKRGLA